MLEIRVWDLRFSEETMRIVRLADKSAQLTEGLLSFTVRSDTDERTALEIGVQIGLLVGSEADFQLTFARKGSKNTICGCLGTKIVKNTNLKPMHQKNRVFKND